MDHRLPLLCMKITRATIIGSIKKVTSQSGKRITKVACKCVLRRLALSILVVAVIFSLTKVGRVLSLSKRVFITFHNCLWAGCIFLKSSLFATLSLVMMLLQSCLNISWTFLFPIWLAPLKKWFLLLIS